MITNCELQLRDCDINVLVISQRRNTNYFLSPLFVPSLVFVFIRSDFSFLFLGFNKLWDYERSINKHISY